MKRLLDAAADSSRDQRVTEGVGALALAVTAFGVGTAAWVTLSDPDVRTTKDVVGGVFMGLGAIGLLGSAQLLLPSDMEQRRDAYVASLRGRPQALDLAVRDAERELFERAVVARRERIAEGVMGFVLGALEIGGGATLAVTTDDSSLQWLAGGLMAAGVGSGLVGVARLSVRSEGSASRSCGGRSARSRPPRCARHSGSRHAWASARSGSPGRSSQSVSTRPPARHETPSKTPARLVVHPLPHCASPAATELALARTGRAGALDGGTNTRNARSPPRLRRRRGAATDVKIAEIHFLKSRVHRAREPANKTASYALAYPIRRAMVQEFQVSFPFASLALCLALSASVSACDDDASDARGNNNTTPPPSNTDSGTTRPPTSADAITESVLAACPQSSTLIQSAEWPSCLAGKRVSGTEPFNNSPCELRIGENGTFEYLRSGNLALKVPERSGWRGATGTYQNELSAGRRVFLAGIAPDLPMVEGQPQVTNVNLGFFSVTTQDETVEIQYLDASRARQTYNCKVDVL